MIKLNRLKYFNLLFLLIPEVQGEKRSFNLLIILKPYSVVSMSVCCSKFSVKSIF